MKKLLDAILTPIFNVFAAIKWDKIKGLFNHGKYYSLTEPDLEYLRAALKPNYYIILTRRKNHLTTYLIAIASLITTQKASHYTHALMNVDDGNVKNDEDFMLMEATSKGVHYSSFMEVFDCDSVALLRPKGYTDKKWTKALDALLKQNGKKYDNLFDVSDDTKVSCVEMCYQALKQNNLPGLEALMEKHAGNLTPQMLYDCGDFDIVWETRR